MTGNPLFLLHKNWAFSIPIHFSFKYNICWSLSSGWFLFTIINLIFISPLSCIHPVLVDLWLRHRLNTVSWIILHSTHSLEHCHHYLQEDSSATAVRVTDLTFVFVIPILKSGIKLTFRNLCYMKLNWTVILLPSLGDPGQSQSFHFWVSHGECRKERQVKICETCCGGK